MRVNLIIIFIISVVCSSWSQEIGSVISIPEFNILFRHYDNKVRVGIQGAHVDSIRLVAYNAHVEKGSTPYEYIVRPGKSRQCQLFVVSEKKGFSDTINTFMYRVADLPIPTMYWGNAKNGNRANIKESKIFVKYPPSIPWNVAFSIENWELAVNNQTIKGKGNRIEEAKKILEEVESQCEVQIYCEVLFPDGKLHLIKGTWKVDSWQNSQFPKKQIYSTNCD